MKSKYPHISVVIPSYRCSECLIEICQRLNRAISQISSDYEIIFVNDCSPDTDWDIIVELSSKDPRIKGVNFSRNFGQHIAIAAGVDHADGEWVVVMDGDLQDRPEEIPNLYRKAKKEKLDVVIARRKNRQDKWYKIFASLSFAWFFTRVTTLHIEPRISNFSIFSHRVVNAYRNLREGSRSHTLVLLWCGFRVGYLEVVHAARFAGHTTYNLRRSVALAVDSITSQSNKPLLISMKFGFLIAGISFMFAIYNIFKYFFMGIPVSGWTSLIVSFYLIGGILMVNMGVIGLYVGKIFNESKDRPIYLVRETLNIKSKKNYRLS